MSYDSPRILSPKGGGSWLYSNLPVGDAAATIPTGTQGYTVDQGLCVWTGSGWQVVAGGGGGSVLNSISVTLPSGNTDWGPNPPAGYQAGITNRILVTADAANSVLTGLLIAPDNWRILVVNVGSAGVLEFAHHGGASAGNQFNTQMGITAALPAYSDIILKVVSNLGWFL